MSDEYMYQQGQRDADHMIKTSESGDMSGVLNFEIDEAYGKVDSGGQSYLAGMKDRIRAVQAAQGAKKHPWWKFW